jgi:hypothetical protein
MINYFKGLEGADFAKLLKDEFDMDAPLGVPSYQKEYLFKYMIQGMTFHNKTGDDLIKYAVDRTESLVKTQPHLLVKNEPKDIKPTSLSPKATKVAGKRSGKIVGTYGEVRFLAHRNVWVGFGENGKVCVTKKTQEAVIAYFAD